MMSKPAACSTAMKARIPHGRKKKPLGTNLCAQSSSQKPEHFMQLLFFSFSCTKTCVARICRELHYGRTPERTALSCANATKQNSMMLCYKKLRDKCGSLNLSRKYDRREKSAHSLRYYMHILCPVAVCMNIIQRGR